MTTILEHLVERTCFECILVSFCFETIVLCVGKISVLASDGRLFVGRLRSFDQSTNIVLSDCVERIFSEEAPVEFVQLGLYILRGDNMYVNSVCVFISVPSIVNKCRALIGEVDEDIDSCLDFSSIRAPPIPSVCLSCKKPYACVA